MTTTRTAKPRGAATELIHAGETDRGIAVPLTTPIYETTTFVFDSAEEVDFRTRFAAASVAGRLDWPPFARVGRTIRVYDPADRSRYLAGAPIHTIEQPAGGPR